MENSPMPQTKEDPDLAEVKAVLKRLQRLDLPSAERSPTAKIDESPPYKEKKKPAAATGEPGLDIFARKRAAIEGSTQQKRPASRLTYLLGGALVAGGLVLAGIALLPVTETMRPSGAEKTPPQPAAVNKEEVRIVAEARQLLNEGNIMQARARLLQGEPEKRAELALMLAQSYDPNYLRALPK